MKYRRVIVIFIVLILLGALAFFSINPAGNVVQIGNSSGVFSDNWAGYVVVNDLPEPSLNSVDSVSAYWNVSEIKCSAFIGDYFSSFWVGIDGIFSESIDQIGTDSDCINGVPYYYAWYEILPSPSVPIEMKINPSDKIYAEVKAIGNSDFQLTLINLNTNEKFQIIEKDNDSTRTTAEIIVEAPYIENKSIAHLTDFGPVEFYNVSIIIENKTGSIDYKKWVYKKLIMVDKSKYIKATPSDLSKDGKQFYVYWKRSV